MMGLEVEEGEREIKGERLSIYCFTSQIAAKAETGLNSNQETGTPSGGFPHLWQEPKHLIHPGHVGTS